MTGIPDTQLGHIVVLPVRKYKLFYRLHIRLVICVNNCLVVVPPSSRGQLHGFYLPPKTLLKAFPVQLALETDRTAPR